MRAITLLTMMVVAISLVAGVAIAIHHHQQQDQDPFAADAAAYIAAAKAFK